MSVLHTALVHAFFLPLPICSSSTQLVVDQLVGKEILAGKLSIKTEERAESGCLCRGIVSTECGLCVFMKLISMCFASPFGWTCAIPWQRIP